MEAPPVQYTTTSDGVSIAWAEAGQGPALLNFGSTPWTHVQEQVAVWVAAFEALAQSFRLVTFDARGTGMSERDVAGVSAETLVLDAQAVIDAAKLDRFIAGATGNLLAVSTCLRIATAFPERMTHVVLESPFQNMREIADTSMGKAGLALAELDWTAYLQTMFRVLAGWDAGSSLVESYVAAVGGWVDQPVGIQYLRAFESVDISNLLPQVRQPTLVMRNDPYFVPARLCQRVAAKIPGAQFRQYSDPTFEQQAELIRAFVEPSSPSSPLGAPAVSSALRTVLFTDIVGHTEMMSRLGDTKGRDVLREHERITREVLKAHGGTEVKTMGDGFMASFGSVTKAVECAVALQRAFEEWNAGVGRDVPAERLYVRVGLNAGEPIEEDGDLFGATVILAARIAAKADGGEILVADTVRGLCSGKGFLFADRGEFVAKGFEEPVRVYEVRWRE
jgi:class 3 adenylate cyclase/pimeloyl-ACP methyl ester carboxylesterase